MKTDFLGPRFIVKRDSESSIGRGCILLTAHFRPEIACIPWAIGQAVMQLGYAIPEIWITEGFRPWDGDDRDLHPELRALDFTLVMEDGSRATESQYQNVASLAAETLGRDYQLPTHGEGWNLHIHAELDPR